MPSANLFSLIGLSWKKFDDNFDKNSHGIWGLPTILKTTLAILFLSSALYFSGLFDITNPDFPTSWLEIGFILIIIGLVFWWLIFLPVLSLQLLWRLTKHSYNIALTYKENIEKLNNKKNRKLLFGYVNLFKLNSFLFYIKYKNLIEYKFSELFDASPKMKRSENYDKYLTRIDAKYAFRQAKYFKIHWGLLAFRAYWADYSVYQIKDRKIIKKLAKAITKQADYWDQKFREANWRYYEEIGKYK